MTPEASLQNKGKREPSLRQGPRRSCAGGGRSPGHALLPAPGPQHDLGGPRRCRAHCGPAVRAWHLREKAARALSSPRCWGPVLHHTFSLPRFQATARAASKNLTPPRPLTLQPPDNNRSDAFTAHFLPVGPIRTFSTPEARPLLFFSLLRRQVV